MSYCLNISWHNISLYLSIPSLPEIYLILFYLSIGITIRLWEWSQLLVNRGARVALIDNVHSDMARFNHDDDDDGDDDDDDDDDEDNR